MKKIFESFDRLSVHKQATQVLPFCKMIGQDGNHFTVEYEGSKVFVFETFESAQNFVDNTLKEYFRNNKQQLLYMYNVYVKEDGWEKFVDWNKAFAFFKENYDSMVDGNFKKENKETMLKEIGKDFKSYIKKVCNGIGILSSFLFDFIDLQPIIEDIADEMEFRVYEHGDFFYVPEIKLP